MSGPDAALSGEPRRRSPLHRAVRNAAVATGAVLVVTIVVALLARADGAEALGVGAMILGFGWMVVGLAGTLSTLIDQHELGRSLDGLSASQRRRAVRAIHAGRVRVDDAEVQLRLPRAAAVRAAVMPAQLVTSCLSVVGPALLVGGPLIAPSSDPGLLPLRAGVVALAALFLLIGLPYGLIVLRRVRRVADATAGQ